MMATTHAFAGLLVAAPIAVFFPEHATPVALAALSGGVFPDLDVFIGRHRRTLHFPVLYWGLCLGLGVAGLVVGLPELLYAAVFVLAAALHSVSDVLGGGLEKEPWKQTTDCAVYCHVSTRWVAPRHYIAYDGSKGDLLATCILATSAVAYAGVPHLWLIVGGGIGIAAGYTLVRRWLPAVEDWLYENVPFLHPFLDGLH